MSTASFWDNGLPKPFRRRDAVIVTVNMVNKILQLIFSNTPRIEFQFAYLSEPQIDEAVYCPTW